MKQLIPLIGKEFLLDWKNKISSAGVLLFVFSVCMVIYMSLLQQGALDKFEVKYWNIFYWITILFTSSNAITRSFSQENSNRFLYYYQLVNPQWLIVAKQLYHFLELLILALVAFVLFSMFFKSPVQNLGVFMICILSGTAGFTLLFTMIAAIASKAVNNGLLMTILGFPIVIPLIIFIMRLCRESFSDQLSDNFVQNLAVVLLLNLVIFLMSFVLFPYLWRD